MKERSYMLKTHFAFLLLAVTCSILCNAEALVRSDGPITDTEINAAIDRDTTAMICLLYTSRCV